MKKILFTAAMLVCFTAISKAQQRGVGINTTTPSSTLDVAANITDATLPDAVLVPRMTASELNAKNSAYNVAQNGALVFVTTGTGTAGTRTANVTGTGFYYYNNPTSLWVAIGGASIGMSVRQQTGTTISNADLGNAVIVTVAGSTFNLDVLTKTNGRTITFIDNVTGGGGFNITGTAGTISPNASVSPTGPGGSLSYICDGAIWYSLNGY